MKRKTKITAIFNWLTQGYTDKQIREELNISESTYFYWKRRIAEEGLNKTIIKQKPGPIPSASIDQELRNKILHWRDRYGWSPVKIEGHLKEHCNIMISHRQIYYLLCKTKRNNSIDYVRRIKGKKRYQRMHSMSLLHIDWKDVRTIAMLTILDDYSRFIPVSKKFSEATTENSIKLVEFVIKKFGVPIQILTDRGSQFWNNRINEPNDFGIFCKNNGINHILCSKGSPQANGKLEAFHGCYDNESWRFKTHGRFIHYWNYRRPHGGIGYKYPAEIFYKDIETPINSG